MSVSTKNPPSTLDDDGGVDAAVDDRNKDFGKSKGKRVSCFRFSKVKRTILRRKRKGVSGNSEGRREFSGGGGGGGCYLCLKRPLTSDSGGESQTSDPNSPNFTYEMFRLFIEKNDFYSNECNPHLDVDSKPSSNQDDK